MILLMFVGQNYSFFLTNDQVLPHFFHDCIVIFLRKEDYMAKCHIGTSLFLLIYKKKSVFSFVPFVFLPNFAQTP